MLVYINKPQTIKQLLINSCLLYKQTILKVWPWAFLIALINHLPTIHLALAGAPKDAVFTNWQTLGLFAIILLTSFLAAVLMHRMVIIVEKPELSFHVSWQVAKNKIFSIWAGVCLTTILTLLGLMLFILPGVIISILTILWLPLILFDNVNVIDALVISCKWVWQFWFKVFFLVLMPILFMFLLIAVNKLLFVRYSIGDILSGIFIMTFIIPYLYSVILIIYSDIRARYQAVNKS